MRRARKDVEQFRRDRIQDNPEPLSESRRAVVLCCLSKLSSAHHLLPLPLKDGHAYRTLCGGGENLPD
ncbi:hypothetical protein IF2G_01831 [Cordyceps javanica]|nr:hypothetical protein IF2G_01831 [Cordyceps javanica]